MLLNSKKVEGRKKALFSKTKKKREKKKIICEIESLTAVTMLVLCPIRTPLLLKLYYPKIPKAFIILLTSFCVTLVLL